DPDDPLVLKILETEKTASRASKSRAKTKNDRSAAESAYLGMVSHRLYLKKDVASLERELKDHPSQWAIYIQNFHKLHRDDLVASYAKPVTDPMTKASLNRFIERFKDGSYDKPQPPSTLFDCPKL